MTSMVATNIEASQSGVIALAYGYGLPVIATPVGGIVEPGRSRTVRLAGSGGIARGDRRCHAAHPHRAGPARAPARRRSRAPADALDVPLPRRHHHRVSQCLQPRERPCGVSEIAPRVEAFAAEKLARGRAAVVEQDCSKGRAVAASCRAMRGAGSSACSATAMRTASGAGSGSHFRPFLARHKALGLAAIAAPSSSSDPATRSPTRSMLRHLGSAPDVAGRQRRLCVRRHGALCARRRGSRRQVSRALARASTSRPRLPCWRASAPRYLTDGAASLAQNSRRFGRSRVLRRGHGACPAGGIRCADRRDVPHPASRRDGASFDRSHRPPGRKAGQPAVRCRAVGASGIFSEAGFYTNRLRRAGDHASASAPFGFDVAVPQLSPLERVAHATPQACRCSFARFRRTSCSIATFHLCARKPGDVRP